MPLFRIFAGCILLALPAVAQPASAARTVEFGHIHLNSADPDSAIAFWHDVIGADPYSHATLRGVSMIGAIILFTRKAPSGPSAGSTIDDIGLIVPDLEPFVEKLAKTSYKSIHPPGSDDRLIIDGPDGVRIELIADSSTYPPLAFHDIQFHTSQPKEMLAWYVKNFGARADPGGDANSLQIRGATLLYAQADSAAASAGRAIDHIGFEIKDLAAYCKTLADNGIKLDSPYRSVPELNLAIAFLTDPWGTRIELTEGLTH
jgi:catechol 2,3-dioxygenase-like lactoylglutathione lyase family enzyme